MFAAMSFLWGIPYLFIKVAVDAGLSPAFVSWSRVLLAAAVLLALAARAGLLSGLRGRWRWLAAYAVLEIAIPFPLIAAGEQHIDSSLAAIIIAAAPLLVAVLAIRFDASERVRGRRLVGLLVGFSGVVALVGLDVAGSSAELLGTLAVLVAAVGYAAGPMTLRAKLSDLDPRATMGASLAIATVLLTPLTAVSWPSEMPPTDAVIAIVVLGLLCTAAAFVVFGLLIGGRRGPRARDHLRQPGRRGRARDGGARRAARGGSDRRAAADPRRLVAGNRRPAPARPRACAAAGRWLRGSASLRSATGSGGRSGS